MGHRGPRFESSGITKVRKKDFFEKELLLAHLAILFKRGF